MLGLQSSITQKVTCCTDSLLVILSHSEVRSQTSRPLGRLPSSSDQAPLAAVENYGGHTTLRELLADLPSFLDYNDKLLPHENIAPPSRETTPTSSTPSKGLLDYWSPTDSQSCRTAQATSHPSSCKRAQTARRPLSCKRAQTTSPLPVVKRQRRSNGTNIRKRLSLSTKTNNHNNMINDYMAIILN